MKKTTKPDEEERKLSLRKQGSATGVLLGDGEMWDGIERRTSRLLQEKKRKVAKKKEAEAAPSTFFA